MKTGGFLLCVLLMIAAVRAVPAWEQFQKKNRESVRLNETGCCVQNIYPEGESDDGLPGVGQPKSGMLRLPYAPRAGDIAIDATNFPDPVFRNYVSNTLDTNHDGYLTPAECDAVTSINVANQSPQKIQSLQGVGFFPNLQVLRCDTNAITSLDLSGNPNLTNLFCSGNQLTSLNLASNPKLRVLECYGNPITSLDLSQNQQLEQVSCGGPQFDDLNVSNMPSLQYLNILNGTMTSLDLSGTPNLQSLICAGTQISSIDLSGNPDLQYISLAGNQLRTVDVSHNTQLQYLDVEQNRLVSIHMGNVSVANPIVNDQNANTILLGAGQSTYNLTQLDPQINPAEISNLKNATLNGTTLEGIRIGTPVTYDYTSNGVTISATLDFVEGNVWTVPLHITGWTYGDPPNAPEAEAEYGTVHYLYGQNGVFSSDVPTTAGNWVVKAVVDPSDTYAGLEDEVPFVISKAVPPYTVPTGLQATYGDTLNDVALPPGFSWENGGSSVGDAGVHTFDAVYTPSDTENYLTVNSIPVQVTVLPKNGEGFDVSPIQNQQDVENIVIRDGTTVLVPGRDYTVTETPQQGSVLVTIQFIGNYTGTIYRSYSTGGGSSDSPQTGDPYAVAIGMWTALSGIAAGGIAIIAGRTRHKKR